MRRLVEESVELISGVLDVNNELQVQSQRAAQAISENLPGLKIHEQHKNSSKKLMS